ncbi:MAG: hypothetical protein LUH10_18340 [Tannerellaceae bacterium]|nr:hypothetical protein [Tannerellaceae bacterium]
MKQNNSYEVFLETLQKRFPDKKTLALRLVDILHIEKEAVYRRLRGTVPFSFTDIAAIALHFDISLDDILIQGADTIKTRPLRLMAINYCEPTEEDYLMLEGFAQDLKSLSFHPESEFITITNTIPQIFYIRYEHIYRFYLFKWHYEEGSNYTKIPFCEIHPSERLKNINKEYLKHCVQANETIIIWDKYTLQMLEEDIRYFYDIRLITKEEVELIRLDLLKFIDELEKITINGKFENGNKVQLYVSHISIKGSYNCLSFNRNYKLSMIKWFTINDTVATDSYTYQMMKNRMSSLQRSSTLISESGEIQRIKFLDEQRKIVAQLENL